MAGNAEAAALPEHKCYSNNGRHEEIKPADDGEGNQTKRIRSKTRRGKAKRNWLKSFKLLYNNIRGIKLKKWSLERIIEEENPTMIGITETKLDKNDLFDLDKLGYTVKRVDRTNDG